MFSVLVLAWLFLPIYIAAGVRRWDVVFDGDLLVPKAPAWLLGLTSPAAAVVLLQGLG